jgi:hypothetical protein
MPDIKTALATALKEWEPPTEGTVIEAAAPAPTPKPTPRPNMTRDTFAMVRDNPGITRADAMARLEAMGHKPISTSTTLYQMVRAKMIDEVDGALSTKRKNYTSLTHALEKAPKGRRKTRMQKPKVIEAAPKPQATHAWVAPEPQAAPVKTARTLMEEDRQRVSNEIDEWLNGVTLRYASLVYERLHYIFGANK